MVSNNPNPIPALSATNPVVQPGSGVPSAYFQRIWNNLAAWVNAAIIAVAPAPANPSTAISGPAHDGSATTYMRSDAAPALSETGVSAGSYTLSGITIDAYGRITAASNGSGSTVTWPTQGDVVIAPASGDPLGVQLADGQVLVGQATLGAPSAPQAVTVSGDATLSDTGALTLVTTGVTAGSYTYGSFTVDAKGRLTAASSGTAPPSSANPSADVGLAAVNGSATTFMRSDAAPPLSQSISPTWTGNHTFDNQVTLDAGLLATGNINVSGQNYILQGETTSFGTPITTLFQQIAMEDVGGVGVGQFTNDANGPIWNSLKSRSTTVGSFAALELNDVIGQFGWYGDDGTTYNNHVANVQANVDGTVSTGIVPGALYFRTQNAAGAIKTAFKIDSGQNINVGTSGTIKIADATGNLYAVNETISGVKINTNTSYQTLATGFSITLSSTIEETVNIGTTTLATGTITLPTSPANGQVTVFTTCAAITALTVSATTGQSVVGAPSSLAIDGGFKMKYRSSNTTWYPTGSG